MVEGKKRTIFAVLNHEAGRGPARLRRLVWDQEIAGSNPAAPTTKAAHNVSGFFVYESEGLLHTDESRTMVWRMVPVQSMAAGPKGRNPSAMASFTFRSKLS